MSPNNKRRGKKSPNNKRASGRPSIGDRPMTQTERNNRSLDANGGVKRELKNLKARQDRLVAKEQRTEAENRRYEVGAQAINAATEAGNQGQATLRHNSSVIDASNEGSQAITGMTLGTLSDIIKRIFPGHGNAQSNTIPLVPAVPCVEDCSEIPASVGDAKRRGEVTGETPIVNLNDHGEFASNKSDSVANPIAVDSSQGNVVQLEDGTKDDPIVIDGTNDNKKDSPTVQQKKVAITTLVDSKEETSSDSSLDGRDRKPKAQPKEESAETTSTIINDHPTVEQQLWAELAKMQAHVEGLTTQNSKLAKEKGQLTVSNEKFRKQVADLTTEKGTAVTEKEALEAEVAGLEAEMAGLEDAKSGLDTTLACLVTSNTALEGEVAGLKEAKSGLEGALDGLMASNTALEAEVAGLKEAKSGLEGSLDVLMASNTALEGEVATLKEAKSGLEGMVADFVALNTALEGDKTKLEAEVEALTNTNGEFIDLAITLESTKEANEELEHQVSDLQRQVSDLEAENFTVTTESADLTIQLDFANQSANSARELVNTALATLREVHSTIQDEWKCLQCERQCEELLVGSECGHPVWCQSCVDYFGRSARCFVCGPMELHGPVHVLGLEQTEETVRDKIVELELALEE